MSTARTERISMSPAEQASRDRRIARAVKDGISIPVLRRRFGVGEVTIKRACEKCGVEIPKGGNRL